MRKVFLVPSLFWNRVNVCNDYKYIIIPNIVKYFSRIFCIKKTALRRPINIYRYLQIFTD